jgi:hypothetical protein
VRPPFSFALGLAYFCSAAVLLCAELGTMAGRDSLLGRKDYPRGLDHGFAGMMMIICNILVVQRYRD